MEKNIIPYCNTDMSLIYLLEGDIVPGSTLCLSVNPATSNCTINFVLKIDKNTMPKDLIFFKIHCHLKYKHAFGYVIQRGQLITFIYLRQTVYLQTSQKVKNTLQMNLMLVVTAKHEWIIGPSEVQVHSTSNGTQSNCATGYFYIILLICNQLLFMSHATEGIKGKEVSSRK